MSRLVIDVTQLAQWQGKLTGIPRVMSELASRFAVDDQAHLVVWDNQVQAFKEVQYNEIMPQLANNSIDAQARISTPTIKRMAKAVERRVPLVQKARRRVQAKARSAVSTKRSAQSVDAFDISATDTLVVLWGHWHVQTYIDKLANLQQDGVKLVQFIYDMLPLVTPQFSGHATESLGNYAKRVYPICSLLLAISKNSKHDVEDWLKTHKLHVPPVEVIRLGEDFAVTKSVKPTDSIFHSSRLMGKDYILCVGTIEARKNHTLLYYTYKLAQQRGVKLPKLVIVGRRGWLTDDIFTLMTTDPHTKDNFVILQNTTDEELSWLYQNCLFSIYPSFYEGWGLPIAESLAHGVPCIASNTSSMPEIAGNLIDYFSPVSTEECLAAIRHLLQPPALAAAKKKIAKYRPTSWNETCRSVTMYIEEYAK